MFLPRIRRALNSLHRDERGQVIFLVVALLTVFGGMTAIAIDLGSYMANRRDLQNAADAIALAASQDLPGNAGTHAAANQWAANNDIDLSAMTVTITPQSLPNTPNPLVQVDLETNHSFVFARLVGITDADIEVSAIAIKTSPGGSAGLMPWSVQESAKNLADPGDQVVLKYDANNVANGNFGPIRIDGNGASIYEETIKFGSDDGLCAVGVADCVYPSTVQTQPGNMIGPSSDGTDYRLDHTEAACDTWAEVVVTSADGTHGLTSACNPFGNGGNPDSLQVIIIPVIANFCDGTCSVDIVEFALFFLEGYGAGGCGGQDCEITGRFISSNTNFGAYLGTYDPDTFAHFVRLVG